VLGSGTVFVVLLCSLFVGSPAGAAAPPPAARARVLASGRVGSAVVTALDTAARVRVMIAFAPRMPSVAAARADVLGSMRAEDFQLRYAYQSIEAVAGEITTDGILALLERSDVLRIDVDAPGTGLLLQALPLMTLTDVNAMGFTGAGVTAAVLDSGVDIDHPDLGDDVVAEACFCSGGGGCCPGGGAAASGPGSADDDHGHGTNVTGIITGAGTVAPAGGARDAAIVAIKVLDDDNAFCCASDVVAGLDYLINNRPEVRIVNLSLGTDDLFGGSCDSATAFTIAFATAIDTLRANGVLTFAATGNNGSGTLMPAPACVTNAVAVGAVWDSALGSQTFFGCTDATFADQVTCFSNSNASTDLFAPGAYMTATGRGGGSSTFGGTSQASPAAAACAAALLEAVPTLGPAEIEAALEGSSTRVTDTTNGLSFPRVDCAESLSAVLGSTTTTTLPAPCGPAPASATGCRIAGKTLFRIKDATGDTKDRLRWLWQKGDATTVGEFLDPVGSASGRYSLCVYDASGSPQPRHEASVAPQGTCGPRRCWSATGRNGFRYRNKTGNGDGISALRLKAGPDGKALLQAKGKGASLAPPPPPLVLPVTVQLVIDGGSTRTCWQAAYFAARRNAAGQFTASSP
jgi:subtilisin family serine protease